MLPFLFDANLFKTLFGLELKNYICALKTEAYYHIRNTLKGFLHN